MSVQVREGVRMSRVEAEAVDAAVEVLCEAGVDYVIARGGKHLAISVGGHKFVISGTPRTDNHKNWARQRARALITKVAEDKELRAPRARRDEREAACVRRKRNVARPTPVPEISDPRPDGWAPLRELHARLSAAAEPALKPRRSIWSALAGVLTGRAA